MRIEIEPIQSNTNNAPFWFGTRCVVGLAGRQVRHIVRALSRPSRVHTVVVVRRSRATHKRHSIKKLRTTIEMLDKREVRAVSRRPPASHAPTPLSPPPIRFASLFNFFLSLFSACAPLTVLGMDSNTWTARRSWK